MNDASTLGIFILVLSAGLSFVVGRWLSRNWRGRKRERERIAREAAQSRQVRRARERQARRH